MKRTKKINKNYKVLEVGLGLEITQEMTQKRA